MQAEYWQKKWNDNQIGFHQDRANNRLQTFWSRLELIGEERIFVPLCGKSLDMLWLHQQGHAVLGIELSEKAVQAFFSENDLSYTERQITDFKIFSGTDSAHGIEILVGDYFALTPLHLAHCQAFYDRAALIAMDSDRRKAYATHLAHILAANTKGLLLSIEYDQTRMEGPPFSVSDEHLHRLLAADFQITELAHYSGPERLGNLSQRGLETLDERVYLLTRNRQK